MGKTRGRVFDCLWMAKGRHGVSVPEICERVWPDEGGGPDSAEKSVHVLIGLLRRDIAPLGLEIQSDRRRRTSYWLRDMRDG